MQRVLPIVLVTAAVTVAVAYRVWTSETLAPPETPAVEVASPTPLHPPAEERAVASEPPSIPTVQTDPEPPAALVRVEGVVVEHGTSRPIANASISVFNDKDGDDLLTTIAAGGDGKFSFDIAVVDEALVKCAAPGFAEANVQIEDGADQLRIAMHRAGSIFGRVLDAESGEPVSDVLVSATTRTDWAAMMREGGAEAFVSQVSHTGTTNDRGEFNIKSISPGAYTLVADGHSRGYLPTEGAPPIVNVVAGGEHETLDVLLRRGGFIFGRAKDEAGKPIEFVTFQVLQDFGGDLSNMLQANRHEPGSWSEVEDDGSFRVGAFAFDTEYKVQAVAYGYAPLVKTVQIPRDRDAGPIDIVFAKGATVAGTAYYESGTPAGEIDLSLRAEGTGVFDWMSNMNGHVETREDGTFAFEHIADGAYTLTSLGQMGFDEDGVLPIEVEGGRDVSGIEFIVLDEMEEPGEPITGTVVDANGAPVAGIEVRVFEMNDFPDETTTTDADGRFSIAAATVFGGGVIIEAAGDAGYKRLTGIQPGSAVRLRLGPSARVSGIVMTAEGDPVADCSVSLESGDDGFMDMMPFSAAGRSATTGEDGRFEFANMKPGAYFAEAATRTQGTGRSEDFEVKSGGFVENVRIVLEPGALLSGRVFDPDRRPLANAQVRTIESASGMFAAMAEMMPQEFVGSGGAATTNNRGEFAIPNVPPGTYTVVATHPQFAKATSPDVDVASGDQITGIDLTMALGGGASGVYTVDGQPMPGVTIQLVGPGGMRMVTTDAEGRFDVTGLPAGQYTLMVLNFDNIDPSDGMAAFSQMMQQTVDIVDGGVTPVEFSPPSGVAISGSIASLGLGEGAMIRLRTPEGLSFSDIDFSDPLSTGLDMVASSGGFGSVNADGSFVVQNVEPGDYVLEVYQEQDPSTFVNDGDFSLDAIQAFLPVLVHSQPISVGTEPIAVEMGAQTPVN